MLAATLSWGIYGAAKEWVRTPERCPSKNVVDDVMQLVRPVFVAASSPEGMSAVHSEAAQVALASASRPVRVLLD
jgi:hypothetical protein